jgi:hypothetical protein
MTTTEQKNFLGIPIHGDITRASSRTPQRPIEELQVAIAELLKHDDFTALRWQQYTPYFNDGDPCVFGVYTHGLKGPDEDAGDYQDGFHDMSSWGFSSLSDEAKEFYGKYERGTYDRETRTYGEGHWEVEPKNPEMIHQAMKVSGMIESGAFNDALLEMFGDHATVTLRRDKIDVEFYEHD